MAKLGVIRFEMSAANDVSRVDGSSAVANVRDVEMVGSDSSSATNGSSVAIVAGKNRFPANPWASTLAGIPDAAMASATLIQLEPIADFLTVILPDSNPARAVRLSGDPRKGSSRSSREKLSPHLPRQLFRGRSLGALKTSNQEMGGGPRGRGAR